MDSVRAWRDLETYLLQVMAEELANLNYETAGFHQRQLEALRRVHNKTGKAINWADMHTRAGVTDEIRAAYEASYRGTGALPQTMPTGALNALSRDAATTVASQGPAILRTVDDSFRQVTQLVSRRAVAAGITHQRALQDALNHFADRGITAYVDKSGRRWGIDTYAEMAIRTATNRAQNQGRRDGYTAMGVEFIRVSWHHAPAPQCAPYQGRILGLNRGPGVYQVPSMVDGETVEVEVVERFDVAIQNGYHHVACRHTDTAFIPGTTPPPEPPPIDDQEYVELQRQRQIERHIRHWKKREAVALTPGERVKAQAKVKAWQKAQRDHVKRHRFLTRQFDREQIRLGKAAA